MSVGGDQQASLNRLEQFWMESEVIIPKASDALARQDLRAFGELADQ
jgi:hypothetical protein